MKGQNVNAPELMPFTWSADPSQRFAALVRDIAAGSRVVVELLETDALAAEEGRELLTPMQRADMRRLIGASLGALVDDADRAMLRS